MPRAHHGRRSSTHREMPDYMEADAPVTRVGPKRRRRVSGRKAPKTKPKTDVRDENDKPTHNARKRLSLGGQGWMDVDTTPSTAAVCFYWTRRVLLVTFFGCVTHTMLWLVSIGLAETSSLGMDPLHLILFDAPLLFVLAYATLVLAASSFILCLFLRPGLRLSKSGLDSKAKQKGTKAKNRARTPVKNRNKNRRNRLDSKKNTPPNAHGKHTSVISTPPKATRLPPPPPMAKEISVAASHEDHHDKVTRAATQAARVEETESEIEEAESEIRSALSPEQSPFDHAAALASGVKTPTYDDATAHDDSTHSSAAADTEPEEEETETRRDRQKLTYSPDKLLAIREHMIAADWQSSGRAVYTLRDHIEPLPQRDRDDVDLSNQSDSSYQTNGDPTLRIITSPPGAPPGFEAEGTGYTSASHVPGGYSASEYSAGSASDTSMSGRSRTGRSLHPGPNKSTVGLRKKEGRRSMRGPNPMRRSSRYLQYQQQQQQQRPDNFGPRRSPRHSNLRLNTNTRFVQNPPTQPPSPSRPSPPSSSPRRRFFSESESEKDFERMARGSTPPSEQEHGFIVFMPTDKYGFIRPGNSRSADDIFFHATEVMNPPISVGDEVEFFVSRPQWSNKPLGTQIRILRRGKSSKVTHGHRRNADFGRSSHYNPHHYSPPPSPAGTFGSARPLSPDRPTSRRLSGGEDVSPGTFRKALRGNRGHSQYFSRFSYPR